MDPHITAAIQYAPQAGFQAARPGNNASHPDGVDRGCHVYTILPRQTAGGM
jgi:hypothetical protein